MAVTRTHFPFRIDVWTANDESIVEHVAGVGAASLPSPLSAPPASAGWACPSLCGTAPGSSRTAGACDLAWSDKGRQGALIGRLARLSQIRA